MSLVAEAIKEALGEGTQDLLARVERELERRGHHLPDLVHDQATFCGTVRCS
jgi:hypothetical protein